MSSRTSTVRLTDKILSLFLIVVLLSSVGTFIPPSGQSKNSNEFDDSLEPYAEEILLGQLREFGIGSAYAMGPNNTDNKGPKKFFDVNNVTESPLGLKINEIKNGNDMGKKLKKFDASFVPHTPIVTNVTDNDGKLKGKKVEMISTIIIEYEKANNMHKKMNNNQTMGKWGNFTIDLGDTNSNGTSFDNLHNLTSGSNMTISERLTEFCESGTVRGFSDHAAINFKSGTKTVVSHGSMTSTILKVNQTDRFDLEIINMTVPVESTKCDLTESLKEYVNFKIMNNSTNDDIHGKKPQKFDKNSNSMKNIYDTKGNPKGMKYGTEDRRITISETYIINATNIGDIGTDNGIDTVAKNNEIKRLESLTDEEALAIVLQAKIQASSSSFQEPINELVIFGFTEFNAWSDSISFKFEICVPLFGCATIVDGLIAYAFRYGFGVRFPVMVNIDQLPVSVPAEDTFNFTTAINPINANITQYTDFCNNSPQLKAHYNSFSYFELGLPERTNGIDTDKCQVFAFPNGFNGNSGLSIPMPSIKCDKFPSSKINDPTSCEAEIKNLNFQNSGDGNEVGATVGFSLGGHLKIFGGTIFDDDRMVDVDLDLTNIVTLYKVYQHNKEELVKIQKTMKAIKTAKDKGLNATDVLKEIATQDVKFPPNFVFTYNQTRENNLDLGSFTAPWGYSCKDKPTIIDPDAKDCTLRGIPYVKTSGEIFKLKWNCKDPKNIIVTPAGPIPICSGMGYPQFGGFNLILKGEFGSDKIVADVVQGNDTSPSPILPEVWTSEQPSNLNGTHFSSNILVDNYSIGEDDTGVSCNDAIGVTVCHPTDFANIELENFKMKLRLVLTVAGEVEFDSPIGDFVDPFGFDIFSYEIPTSSIPRHANSPTFDFDVFVENNALILKSDPVIKEIAGGDTDTYDILFHNVGSIPDDFDNIRVDMSNVANQTEPFEFVIHMNNDPFNDNSTNEDGWGENADGDPGVDDDNDGALDEDPIDVWNYTISDTSFTNVTEHTLANLTLSITPFSHFSIAPGEYPVRVQADSFGAKVILDLEPIDPSDLPRINSTVIPLISIPVSVDPRIYVFDIPTNDKPGVTIPYNLTVQNFGNVDLFVNRTDNFVDFNKNNCDVFTRGFGLEDCPYRADPTFIQNNWENVTTIPTLYEESGELIPGDYRKDPFELLVPRDWAGMENTTYSMNLTVTSVYDGIEFSNFKIVNHTVNETKESNIRYVALEIKTMKEMVINATIPDLIDQGSQTALTQILERAIEGAKDRALKSVCDGNFRGANGGVITAQHQLEALIRAIDGMSPSNIREEFALELISYANAVIKDIDDTVANKVRSTVLLCTDDFGKTTTSNNSKLRTLGIDTMSSDDSATESSDVETVDENTSNDDSGVMPSNIEKVDNSKPNDNSRIDTKTGGSSDITIPSMEKSSSEVEFKSEKVPLWIKHNARWWADKQIQDSDFVLGIQYLIEERVIVISSLPDQTSQKVGEGVPEWVRNNAYWWSDDLISEKEFLDAIKYLVNEGIIQIAN